MSTGKGKVFGKLISLKRSVLFGALVAGMLVCSIIFVDRWVEHTELPNLSLETSVTVLDRNSKLLRAYTVADGRWRLPASVETVDARFVSGLIAYEDKRFYDHNGIDKLAFLRAAGQAFWNLQIISGGSTLTMQVARLLEEGGTGRWGPKVRQIRVALALERRLSKTDILNLYLKLAPYGGNLEGVRAASLSYFGKEPARLTPAQSALLISLPQSPEMRRPDRKPENAKRVRNRVLMRLALANALPLDEAKAAQSEPVPTRRRRFPALAPHLADRLVRSHPAQNIHLLTIERDFQNRLEILAKNYVQAESDRLSVAVLTLDHETGEVLASVGSAGFLDHDRLGFIDMTQSIRSPGSTLKPLIYGLAFEAGLAHPESLIDDKPMNFGAYAPQNFDSQFHGLIPIREALQQSRNIPAVAVLEAVGPNRLLAQMKRAGVRAQLPGGGQPGLAIALGGIGISLSDLTSIYGAIAQGGQPVARREYLHGNIGDKPASRLLSPESAWQVSDILSGVSGPKIAPKNNLAYKTGTSYGHRDAWAIGFDGQHVIGVWMGRPDGTAMPGILGAELAAPLLFESFGLLKQQLTPLLPPPPSTLIVSNSELPRPLKRFRGLNHAFDTVNPPEITFPPDGARVDLGLSQGRAIPLVLKVRDGVPPFTWISDGKPFLIASHDRTVQMKPDGPGHLTISVIDSTGQSRNTTVEIQ